MNSAIDMPSPLPGATLPHDSVIFGSSPAMAIVRQKLEKIADTGIPVLIQGESGTGKEVIANYLHQNSVWSSGRFVKVNCPAIPDTLVESELFGYERGAFTGAVNTKPGRVEAAERGTLFLDEISEIGFSLQSKLLQLLQDGRFCPIGGQQDKQVDVRVVCATNHNLAQEVEAGRFRQDLYYRINVVCITLPPLRDRLSDLPVLVDYFLQQHSIRYGLPLRSLSPATMALLSSHHWPGNIRELENLTKRLTVFGPEDLVSNELHGGPIVHSDIQSLIPTGERISLKKITRQAVKDLEMKIIVNILRANHGNRRRTARALEISYRALLYKLKDAGIDGQIEDERAPSVADRLGNGSPIL
jgi:two-component system, NtrC family, response regulator AtoC